MVSCVERKSLCSVAVWHRSHLEHSSSIFHDCNVVPRSRHSEGDPLETILRFLLRKLFNDKFFENSGYNNVEQSIWLLNLLCFLFLFGSKC